MRKQNRSQAAVKNYDKIDTKLKLIESDQQIPLLSNKESSFDQSCQIQPIKGQEPLESELSLEAEPTKSVKLNQELNQSVIEEENNDILQDQSIKKLIASNGHKNFVSRMFDTQTDSKPSVQEINNQTHHKPPKEKVLTITNIDWAESYIGKSIEYNKFDINEITLEE